MFESAKLKIERAKHHIIDLNGEVDIYSAQHPLRIFRSFDGKASQVTYSVKTKIPMPDLIPLIIGDAIHNLRAALDLLIFDMVGDKCKTAGQRDRIQFPFAKSAQSLGATIKTRQVHLAGEKVVKEIHNLKPYPGGNEKLYAIHTLDITDKHRLIIPTSGNAGMTFSQFRKAMPEMPFRPKEGVHLVMASGVQFTINMPRPQGSRRARRAAQSKSTPERETNFKPTSIVCFSESQPFPMQPVVPALTAMTEEVERAVVAIAKAAK